MVKQSALRTGAVLTAAFGLALTVGACKIIKNEPPKEKAKGELEIFFADDKFNPDKVVADMWDEKILPFAKENAKELAVVLKALGEDRDKAGETYGHREKPEGSPWNYVVRTEAKVVDAKTKSRAATLGLDLPPYDGTRDVLLQIGPVIKGTSIRDSLDFLKFDDFTNQLEFARVSNAMNKRVNDVVLAPIDRENAIGKTLKLTGMFTDNGKSKPVLITPVQLEMAGE